MKTTLALVLASLVGSTTAALAESAPIGPDFVGSAPRLHIDRSLVASPAMNRIDPVDVVAFAFDSATLRADGVDQVDSTARWLTLHPEFQLVLEGHTDAVGPALHNEDLATRRMATVRQRLIAWGVHSDRIVLITYGEREAIVPANPNDRRVEMFATRQLPQTVVAQQLANRNVIVAAWTDRRMLMQRWPALEQTARR